MLFLDEPFAFTQIWVTSQTFPEESHFDLYVECNAEQTSSPMIKRGPE